MLFIGGLCRKPWFFYQIVWRGEALRTKLINVAKWILAVLLTHAIMCINFSKSGINRPHCLQKKLSSSAPVCCCLSISVSTLHVTEMVPCCHFVLISSNVYSGGGKCEVNTNPGVTQSTENTLLLMLFYPSEFFDGIFLLTFYYF